MSRDYDLDFMKKFRPYVYKMMRDELAGKRTAEFQRKLDLYEKAGRLRAKLWSEIAPMCKHPLNAMKYTEHGREDEYGSWARGLDRYIKCGICGKTLWEHHDNNA